MINTTTYIWLIAACGIATYLTRLPGLWLGKMISITPRLKRGLDSIPVGVFAAMVVPSLVNGAAPSGHLNIPFVMASIVAAGIALLTKHPLWTMLGGVIAIALFRLV
ncbi:AzlD domain-containing protein [Alicyclobacillus curvatus]|jgi:branched-subunit amino acid transport protein|nr:AzlD domain-containing protein [Alicyclobacillus curvatus]